MLTNITKSQRFAILREARDFINLAVEHTELLHGTTADDTELLVLCAIANLSKLIVPAIDCSEVGSDRS